MHAASLPKQFATALEDDINSVFFEPDDPEELARKLISLSQQPDYMDALSEAGLRTIRDKYSVQAMTRAFEVAVTYAFRQRERSAVH